MRAKCQYCKKRVGLVPASRIYPDHHYLEGKWFYFCKECDAWVGTHPNKIPLGSLANKELRMWRRKTHYFLDRLWREGQYTRKEAYKVLQSLTGLSEKKAHIAKFNIEQCQSAINKLQGEK